MDYKAVLDKLRETSPEGVAIIETHVKTLNNESATRRHELTKLQSLVDSLQAIAGEGVDLLAVVKEAKTAEKKLADMQTQLETAQQAATNEKREVLLIKGAQLVSADQNALRTFLKDVSTDKITIDDAGKDIKIEGKPLKDYVATQGEFWSRALFPTTPNAAPGAAPGAAPESLPTGGANPDAIKSPVDTYLAQKAAVFEGMAATGVIIQKPS
jgi:hypothetical protein